MLRRGVSGIADLTGQPRRRGDIDEIATAALDHSWHHGSCGVNLRHNVNAPASLPAIVDRIQTAFCGYGAAYTIAIAHPCVRDKHIDAATLTLDLIDKGDDLRFVADIEFLGDPVYFSRNIARGVGLNIRDDDFDTIGSKSTAKRTSDTVATARYNSDFDWFVRLVQLLESRRIRSGP